MKIICVILIVTSRVLGAGLPAPAQIAPGVPTLDSTVSPLAEANRKALLQRLVTYFDQTYLQEMEAHGQESLAGDMAFYYFRQELQSLVDMWRATGNKVYLEQARLRASRSIVEANQNTRLLRYRDQERGQWPCFLMTKVESVTGGHSQLVDFQGATGLLMIARALQLAQMEGANVLGTFVEDAIVAKWANYNPAVTLEQLRGPQANAYLLSMLDSGRDKREHFAVLCMDLHHLGAQGLPYGQFAAFLTQLYVGLRPDQSTIHPFAATLKKQMPPDWGLIPQAETGGLIWYYAPSVGQPLQLVDTSHGNRTVWLACRALSESLTQHTQVEGLIRTLKQQVWKPKEGPFYFSNLVDGTDTPVQGLGAGLKGNLWLGWHRLAAYDKGLRDLFVSLAYDLTNGGEHIPAKAQNKAMTEARLCFYAWAARLLAPEGMPGVFP
jgi:hypothetical protein